MNKRAAYVSGIAGGQESVITSAAMKPRARRTPTNEIPRVEGVTAKVGGNQGEVGLRWNGKVKGKRGFLVEWREMAEEAQWSDGRFVTASRCVVADLTPGKEYEFRVRAVGPRELVGPWSDVVVRRAP